jgi:predicted permease
MGLKAAVGRLLDTADDTPSAAPVAVLNNGYWQRAFGGSRDVVGRTINLNNVPFTIIGVAERRFTGLAPGSDYDVWLPLSEGQLIGVSGPFLWNGRQADVTYWWLTIIGRLKPGTPLAETQTVVSALFRNEMLHGAVPLFHGGETADNPEMTLVPAQSGLTGSRTRYADPLYVLMLAVGIVLLIACANVAGLMLARAAARHKEMAVRLALGAGRARVMRQLLTESVMLSALGGTLVILFAYWGAHAIISFVSINQTRPLGFATDIDLRVLGFTVAVSLITGILFGIAPAFRSARVDMTPKLKEGEGGSASWGHRGGKWLGIGNALVIAQVALAIVVLVRAGVLVRTLQNLRGVDVGFDSRNILIFGVNPELAGYKGPRVDSLYRDLQGRLSETPGVESASYSIAPPLTGGLMITSFHWPGTARDRESDADTVVIGPNFFETLHIPFLAGRGFSGSDFALPASNNGSAPISRPNPVIVNQAFVEKYLGKENPLGIQFGRSAGDANLPASLGYEIIGVVRNTKYNSLRREIHAMMYMPQRAGGASFELRTAADPEAILPAIRKVVAQVDANLPLFDVRTESEQMDRLLFQERLVASLASFFGLLALLLACIGLYGLLSFEVARRTREIGIRMALGGQAGDVLRLVVRQGIALALVGAAVGIGVALGVTRYLTSMLYDVRADDPLTMVAVAALLMLVALAACYIPARRAMRVDPMVALRYE